MSSYYEEVKTALLTHHSSVKFGWLKKRKELKQLPYVVSIICKYCIIRDEVAGYGVGAEAVQLISLTDMDLEKFSEYVKKFGGNDLELLGEKLKEYCPWIYIRLENLYKYRVYESEVFMISKKIDEMVDYVVKMALRLIDGKKERGFVKRERGKDISDDFTLLALDQPLIAKEERCSDLLDISFSKRG